MLVRLSAFVLLGVLLLPAISPAYGEEVDDSSMPEISIDFDLPQYPDLAPIPDSPVYYAPQLQANYFFYDGNFWIFQNDNWYNSPWYNGPWWIVDPEDVPDYILRIPVSYFHQPPIYFQSWQADVPPRWGEHWGNDWDEHRRGWDKWDRHSMPDRAPLPDYQRRFPKEHYPRQQDQDELRQKNYHHRPQEDAVRRLRLKQSGSELPNGKLIVPQNGAPKPETHKPEAIGKGTRLVAPHSEQRVQPKPQGKVQNLSIPRKDKQADKAKEKKKQSAESANMEPKAGRD